MLYIVPVPVGNLEDVTLRAVNLFQKAEVVLCEDGRVSAKLFQLLQVSNKPRFVNLSHNQKFNYQKISSILEEVLGQEKTNSNGSFYHSKNSGENEKERVVVLVSDAGTAGISDPAFEVLRLAREKNIAYSCLPGATALIPAVVNSNLISKEFLFLGFLPIKKGRKTAWEQIITSQVPVVLYESSHRIEKFFDEVLKNLELSREISFSREISKKFEEVFVGRVEDVKNLDLKNKGEFVVVIQSSQK